MTVKIIMTEKVVTLSQHDSYRKAQDLLRQSPFHHILIADEENHLLGIVSDRDMMNQLAPHLSNQNSNELNDLFPRLRIADVMTRDVITVDKETPIDAASVLLLEKNFSCLPVVNQHYKIEGILTWKDLLKYYVYS
ncbi:MAG: CBS domain-containing protein [Reinekea sp.]|jgi:acetoin utilization protein AcuB